MKRLLLSLVLAVAASGANAAMAFWTGRMEQVTTVTYKIGWRCEYNYAGNTFWRVFTGGTCPSSVEVQ